MPPARPPRRCRIRRRWPPMPRPTRPELEAPPAPATMAEPFFAPAPAPMSVTPLVPPPALITPLSPWLQAVAVAAGGAAGSLLRWRLVVGLAALDWPIAPG